MRSRAELAEGLEPAKQRAERVVTAQAHTLVTILRVSTAAQRR